MQMAQKALKYTKYTYNKNKLTSELYNNANK